MISELSKEDQDELYRCAEESKLVKNNELISMFSPIILNFFNQKKYKYKYDRILGPVSATELYSEKYKKHIYIFGEYHVRELDCFDGDEKFDKYTTIVDFLKEVFTFSDVIIDFYLEIPWIGRFHKDEFFREKDDHYHSYIIGLQNEFIKCFQVNKKQCPIKQVRFHYSDIREDNNVTVPMYYDNSELKMYANYRQKTLKEVNDKFFGDNYDLIEKQINNIPYPEVKEKINSIFSCEQMEKKIKDKTIEVLKGGLGNMIKDESKYPELDDIRNYLFHCNVNYMDKYLMSRIFRKFKDVKGKYSGEPQNIIIYVGNYHAQNYVNFLSSLGFETIFSSLNMKRCVDISKMKQPLFHRNKTRSVPSKPLYPESKEGTCAEITLNGSKCGSSFTYIVGGKEKNCQKFCVQHIVKSLIENKYIIEYTKKDDKKIITNENAILTSYFITTFTDLGSVLFNLILEIENGKVKLYTKKDIPISGKNEEFELRTLLLDKRIKNIHLSIKCILPGSFSYLKRKEHRTRFISGINKNWEIDNIYVKNKKVVLSADSWIYT